MSAMIIRRLATLGILWGGLVCFALVVLVHPLIRKAAFTND